MIGKILSVNRIRINTDGPGVTTLVGMYKCPLNCEYCINNPILTYATYTIEELYSEIKIDALYFDVTGGGICFGGHEPLLQQSFIKEFIKQVRNKNHKWKIGMETSLNCKLDDELLKMLDFIIVDIKSINSEIYKKYTEKDNDLVLRNLKIIKDKIPDIKIRIPIIPKYNNEKDVEESKKYLIKLGYKLEQLEIFTYETSLEEDLK